MVKNEFKEYLLRGLELCEIKLDITEDKIEKLFNFLQILETENSKYNLTAIRDTHEIIEKHFLDTMLIYSLSSNYTGKAIDIGTGAGFPGMVLAIIEPELRMLLLDSVNKKINFLTHVKEELALKNVFMLNDRAEQLAAMQSYKGQFDFGFCRAVANLSISMEYVVPFLKVGGLFIAQKSLNYEEELAASNSALKQLKCEIVNIKEIVLPYSGISRILMEIKKIAETDKFPRGIGVAKRNPL